MNLLDFQQPVESVPEAFEAIVADDASGPGVQVRVIIPEFDRQLAHGPCPWTPVVTPQGVWYPKTGDPCVVVRPVEGDPWIAGWSPRASSPDASVGGSFKANVGNGSATEITVKHDLGTRDVQVEVFRNSGSYDTVICEVQRTDTNNVELVFGTAPSSNQYRVLVRVV